MAGNREPMFSAPAHPLHPMFSGLRGRFGVKNEIRPDRAGKTPPPLPLGGRCRRGFAVQGFAAASRCARRRTSASCQASAFRRGGREGAEGGQDIERAQIYAKRLCAHLWVDSMRRRLQHSKGIHRTVVASPLVAEPAYRQRRDSVVRHLRKYCLGNTFQHEAVSIRDMAKDFG